MYGPKRLVSPPSCCSPPPMRSTSSTAKWCARTGKPALRSASAPSRKISAPLRRRAAIASRALPPKAGSPPSIRSIRMAATSPSCASTAKPATLPSNVIASLTISAAPSIRRWCMARSSAALRKGWAARSSRNSLTASAAIRSPSPWPTICCRPCARRPRPKCCCARITPPRSIRSASRAPAKAALPASARQLPPPSTTPSALPARCANCRSRRSGSSKFSTAAASLRLEVGGLHDLAPLAGFRRNESTELGRCAGKRRATQVDEVFFHRRVGKSGVDLPVERLDDRGRRVRRGADADPLACFEARHERTNRRHVRQQLGRGFSGHRQGAQAAGANEIDQQEDRADDAVYLPAEGVGDRRRAAAIGNNEEVRSGLHFKQFAGDVLRRTDRRCPQIELARLVFGVGDQFGKGFYLELRAHRDDHWKADDARDRRNVADEIEIEIVEKRCVDRVAGGDQKQRVAVRRSARHVFGGEIAAGAGAVFDDESLPQPLRKPFRDQAGDDIGRAAGNGADEQADRPGWIGVRTRGAGDGRKSGNARRQMQKSSPWNFHVDPPNTIC